MANRLSHSQIAKHNFCQTAWKWHYKEGYRPTEIYSSLVFGSALGKSIETISKSDNIGVSDEQIFDIEWLYQKVNDETVNLRESKVTYLKSDLDYDLLTPEELKECASNEHLANWFSMRHKGHLMLKAFREDIQPKIKKVYSLEEKVELNNENGDGWIGFSDIVCDIEGYSTPVILDFKTAGRPYDENSVVRSVQLSQYLHVLSEKYNTRLAGYCVFLKNIKKDSVKICSKCKFDGSGGRHATCNNEIKGKRCGATWDIVTKFKCETQLIIDEIPETLENLVIENIEAVNNSINTGVYTKNLSGCWDDGYGKPCQYQKLCWENNPEGLIKKEVKSG